ncbi:hypothetical protein [Alkalicoccobacillus murimartini]|uniref:Outer membrane lipoprotein-sorting protein n=1 Tax=Alkalicoccobacillus murimartini TaxID=171685 RepID=A0ABT9YF91_9BACI|nr:hypothetical protein [Alkalicoccobacillus murimartini]MDQ0205887.1 outer membrane lipoprotein-sorting protein [Alkalicoccobacillus murimartini]
MKRIAVLGVSCFLLSSCSQQMNAEDIIYEAFEKEGAGEVSYIIERSTTSDDAEITTSKEWRDGQNASRKEFFENDELTYITVSNEGLTTYKDYLDETITITDFGEDLSYIGMLSPRQEVEDYINHYSNDFDVTFEGSEELLGRNTFHLKFDIREEHDIAMIGEYELWFDEQTWVILKERLKDGDQYFTTEADSFEVVDEFPDETFVLDNEEGFEENDFFDVYSPEPTSLEEAQDKFHLPFLTLDDSFQFDSGFIRQDLEHDDRYVYDMTFTDTRGSVNIYVETEWGLVEIYGSEEEIEVRDQSALLVDEESLLSLNWQEEGLQYFVEFEGDYSAEDAEEIVTNMHFPE